MATPTQKLIISSAVYLVLVGFSLGIYGFTYRGIVNLGEKLGEIESDIRRLEIERGLARNFKTLVKEGGAQIERIKRVWVDRARPVVFIEDLENLAKKTQTVLTLDLDETKSRGNELFFRVTAEGQEPHIRKFLAAVELMPYAVEIKEFSFRRISEFELAVPFPPKQPPKPLTTHRLILSLEVKTN